jgi:hypothetical protein
MSSLRMRNSVLPVLTTFIGAGGFIIGTWSFVAPASAAQAFGGYMVRITESTQRPESASGQQGEAANLAYVYPHGIRNLGQGLSILALTAYWRLASPCRTSPLARLVAQRCLGIVITVGAFTPVVDAWVNYQVAPDGVEGDSDRNAARVHVMRTGIWLVGGLGCLLA